MKKLVGLLSAGLVAMAIAFTGCSADADSGSSGGNNNATVTYDKPVIGTTLSDVTASQGQEPAPYLRVEVTNEDAIGDENITYQWYNDSGAISGATAKRYTIPVTNVLDDYFYVKVFNAKDTSNKTYAKSNTAHVVVQASSTTTYAGAVTITSNPVSASYDTGASAAALSVSATADNSGNYKLGTLKYQWYMNGTAISGATSSSYTPSTTATASYYCVVTNDCTGSVTGTATATATSSTATITINALRDAETPSITANPAGATYTVNASATALSVTATVSKGTLSYQWYNGNGAISGATSSTYTPSTTAVGSTTYYCVVTNTDSTATGSKTATATSTSATIEVVQANTTVYAAATPVVSDMTAVTYNVGASASSITASATQTSSTSGNIVYETGTLSYNWTLNGSSVSTSQSYTPSTATAGTYTYTVTVTNTTSRGKTASASKTVVVTVNALTNAATPVISSVTGSATYAYGASSVSAVSVTASVTDGGTLSYQWTDANNNVVATTQSFTPSTAAAGTFVYKCVVTNTNNNVNGTKTASATSGTVTVTVQSQEAATTPTFTTDLASTSTSGALTVVANGNGTLTYQWYNASGAISGATSASYTATANGTYYVIVTNTLNGGSKTATSASCVVTLQGSGGITIQF